MVFNAYFKNIMSNGNNWFEVFRVESIKDSYFSREKNHLWRNGYSKSVFMVSKQKFQNLISSLNLNLKCKYWFFLNTFMAVQSLKMTIVNRCCGNKLKNYFLALLNGHLSHIKYKYLISTGEENIKYVLIEL